MAIISSVSGNVERVLPCGYVFFFYRKTTLYSSRAGGGGGQVDAIISSVSGCTNVELVLLCGYVFFFLAGKQPCTAVEPRAGQAVSASATY